MISLEMIYDAKNALKDIVRLTPLSPAPSIGEGIYIKAENLQLTGSFKLRGASYKIHSLTDDEKAKGVIACSAGNHAQGVALSATMSGIKSIICMPAGAPIAKVEATKNYGAEVVLVPGIYDDAYAKAVELTNEHGYTFAHPFNDERVIAGQGTIGLEILDQLPDVVPIGGGGLISGVAFAVKSIKPSCKIIGVQAAGAPSMYVSRQHGEPTELSSVSTIADGIAVKKPGDLTYELCSNYVDEIVTVTDDEIASAILSLLESQKTVAEGAGAVPVAAVMFGKVNTEGKKTVCIVSGGNVDVTTFSRIITKGLSKSGRTCEITTRVLDKPGQLIGLLDIVSKSGANIINVHHSREPKLSDVTHCVVTMTLETRNPQHVEEIRKALISNGYEIIAI